MLPLADGSLRLRTDDEDSSASEDSFFSAAEVTEGSAVCHSPGPWRGGTKAAEPNTSWERKIIKHRATTPGWEVDAGFSKQHFHVIFLSAVGNKP